jgi:hypothetical protein
MVSTEKQIIAIRLLSKVRATPLFTLPSWLRIFLRKGRIFADISKTLKFALQPA